MKFEDQVVWITGASSGIGESMAKAFNREGANVILSARNRQELERVKGEFSRPEIPSEILVLDMQEFDKMPENAEKAISFFGKVNILVNNAGISQRSLAVDTSFEDDLRILNIDLIGAIAITKSILHHLLLQDDAQIVIISSVMSVIHTKYRTSYAAAKHGLLGYFNSLRLEIGDKVNVCNIMPGFINTNIVKNAVSDTFNPDNANAKGMSPDELANLAIKKIYMHRKNVYLGGFKERFAIWLNKFFPSIFDFFIKNAKVA